jgi:hypothetical protein
MIARPGLLRLRDGYEIEPSPARANGKSLRAAIRPQTGKLRVIDPAAKPNMVSGNTNAQAIMIAKRPPICSRLRREAETQRLLL